MAFTPHTEKDIESMLKTLGERSVDALFDEVPKDLRFTAALNMPEALSEMRLTQHMQALAAKDDGFVNYIGAGSYEHFIPAAVWELVGRGEFYTAYTPYQAEASQGGLQVIYEYQTMIASLTGMDVANASVYDGATALAEALLMAVRDNRAVKNKAVLVAGNLHPYYRDTVKTILGEQSIEVVETGVDEKTGLVDVNVLGDVACAALAIAQPNFFGGLEDVDALTNWAHSNNMHVIGCVNPLTLSLLKPPGQWGEKGADIACGDGQPLGVPMASGGPYFGFMTCREPLVRQLPGRIVGRTVDVEGKPGFTLTLQAREQHIRRGKAKSNICTNQGLLVTAATIFMSLLGFEGLKKMALKSHEHAQALLESVCEIPGVKRRFECENLYEFALELPVAASDVLAILEKQKIIAGLALRQFDPAYTNTLLVCVTEVKTEEQLAQYKEALEAAIAKVSV
ncbi:MAG: aminomethyl-transferring glycine dehydrogenase [Gammaproteobacteria bacterium CG11_big_fil_rev_8_21_14_0_20_46_22]|nr:MAG: aminomethyl-transferring glycine dehydrogenase [Gammaproteobacteria bacterium CG12_big_fil_rev_8_21_14_0_65_46_12]PIR10322.1 MAG: aminomethyl-transferring glycine dehydrogenase [Gammaproteobacteria bacterium CG11_big_fil_rev_8_21_14_0_20_46_22]